MTQNKSLRVDLTIFGDMDDKKAFLVAQGDTLMIWGQSEEGETTTSEPVTRQDRPENVPVC